MENRNGTFDTRLCFLPKIDIFREFFYEECAEQFCPALTKILCKLELVSFCLSNSLVEYFRFYILPAHCCSVVVFSRVLYFRTGEQIVSCTLSGVSVLSESTGLFSLVLCVSGGNIFWKKISKSDCVFHFTLGQQENDTPSTWWLQQAFPSLKKIISIIGVPVKATLMHWPFQNWKWT